MAAGLLRLKLKFCKVFIKKQPKTNKKFDQLWMFLNKLAGDQNYKRVLQKTHLVVGVVVVNRTSSRMSASILHETPAGVLAVCFLVCQQVP